MWRQRALWESKQINFFNFDNGKKQFGMSIEGKRGQSLWEGENANPCTCTCMHACAQYLFTYNYISSHGSCVCEYVISICIYIYIHNMCGCTWLCTYKCFRKRERYATQKLISMEQLQFILAIFYSDQLVMWNNYLYIYNNPLNCIRSAQSG